MSKTQDDIRDLFLSGPPPTQEEVRYLISEYSQEDAQRELLQLIDDDVLCQHHFGLFVEIARQLRIASDLANELYDRAQNKHLSFMSRKFAVVAMTTDDCPETIASWFEGLEPELVMAASDMPFVDMLTAIQMDSAISEDLCRVLLDTSPEDREFLLMHHIGRIRREVGTPATMAYAAAFREPELIALYPMMLDAVILERDAVATRLLTELRDQSPTEEARKMFQRALLQMNTKQIEDEPNRNEPEGTAYVSVCDGQGAFFLVVRYRLSEHHFSTITVCIRASGEIRDAFVFPNHTDEEFDSLLADLDSELLAHTEISLRYASEIFDNAKKRSKELNRPLPSAIQPALSVFERLTAEPITVDLEQDDLLQTHNANGEIKNLLSLPYYSSWFFDAGDLTGYGIEPPNGEADDAWYRSASTRLNETPLRERLIAMLDHMVMWHRFNGDRESVAICLNEQKSVVSDFSHSAIVREMLERSLLSESESISTLLDDVENRHDALFGDSVLRTVLRRRFFTKLKRPAGRHVAQLDFTEVTFNLLQTAFSQLPGEKRPVEDDVLEMSKEIAELLVRGMLADQHAEMIMKRVDACLKKYSALCAKERHDMALMVVDGVISFVDSTCAGCSYQCLTHPRKGMADVFFSPSHPALE